MIRLVLTKTHSSLSTLYYLLLDTLIRRRRALAKKTGASMSVNIGALYNTIKGGGAGGSGSSVTGVGAVGSSGAGSGNAIVNAALQNNVNAVAAAATNSLSQRYKSINGVITAVGSSNSSSSNSNAAAAAANQPATVSSPRAMQPQYTGEITEYAPQPQPLSEFNLSRPQSASGVRTSAGAQRPLSAYAARR